MVKAGAIRESDDGSLEVTHIGRIASLFYFSPYDVADLRRNFTALFEKGMDKDDVWIATALARIDSYRDGIVSNAERDELESFEGEIDHKLRMAFGGRGFTPYTLKIIYCYYNILRGKNNVVFAGVTRGLAADIERVLEVVKAVDGTHNDYLSRLRDRTKYGVSWDALALCSINGIGGAKSEKLMKVGISTPAELISRPAAAKAALRCSDKMLEKIMAAAKKLT